MKKDTFFCATIFLAINISMAANYIRHERQIIGDTVERLKEASKEAVQENIMWPHPEKFTLIHSVQRQGYISLGSTVDNLEIRKDIDESSDWAFETNMTNGVSYNGVFTITHRLYNTGEYAVRLVRSHDSLIPKYATQKEAAQVILKQCGDKFRLKLVNGLYISVAGKKNNIKLKLVEDEGCMHVDEATHKVNMMRRPDTEFMLTQPST